MEILKLNSNIFYIIFLTFNVYASEYIKSFISDIKLNYDGTIDIVETITVQTDFKTINHGIYRDFINKYKDRYGNFYNTGFKLIETLLDGKSIKAKISQNYNGVRIAIGKEMLLPGEHVFIINYQTNRQLGFFKDFVEFYFNITGNDWQWPILYACANIILPETLPVDSINVEAYTGYDYGKDYKYEIKKNIIKIFTTSHLTKDQGLTVAINWPHGYFLEPTSKDNIKYFFKDNLIVLVYILLLILLIILFIFLLFNKAKRSSENIAIPLYSPPEGLSPSDMCFVFTQKIDSKAIAADILYLAVNGFLKIEYKESFWSKGSYKLIKIDNVSTSNLQPNLIKLLESIFSKNDNVELPLKRDLNKSIYENMLLNFNLLSAKYFKNVYSNLIYFLSLALFCMLGFASRIYFVSNYVFAISLIIFFVVGILSEYLLKDYTQDGLRLKSEIDGFLMFLSTAQEDFLKIVGSTPQESPKIYEKYLPYVVALGIDNQWNKKFTKYFDELKIQGKNQGNEYIPNWYIGKNFTRNFVRLNSYNNFNKSFIKNFTLPPGTFSGSRGRGRSGGGGGGGGGGF